ncbi:hypothetical protein N5C56_09900 [Pseudomonas chengduensis]|nr:hypothetical protein [Pseudomonas chengduensis]MDH1281013.1 hypothetical protein [Pseudomonas chengduensis]
MSLLNGKDTETTTLLHVIQAAEASQSNHFDLIHLELDSGRELILVAVLADNLGATGRILEGLQDLQSAQ